MLNGKSIDLIIFDCDGVLIDSEVIACDVDAEFLTGAGYPITTEDVIRRFAGVSGPEMIAEIERELGRSLPADFRSAVEQRVLERFRTDLQAISGAREHLPHLNIPRCVASNSAPSKLCLGLIEARLFDLFYPHIFSASLVANGKPEPDLFLHAAQQMGVSPEKCVVVEDSVAGVTGARAAGMTTVGFVGGSHCPDGQAGRLLAAGATTVIDALCRLHATLAEIGRARA